MLILLLSNQGTGPVSPLYWFCLETSRESLTGYRRDVKITLLKLPVHVCTGAQNKRLHGGMKERNVQMQASLGSCKSCGQVKLFSCQRP